MNAALQDKLKELPKDPGVYFHKDAAGEIIYVGKAAVLRNRVRQYFQKSRARDPKTWAGVGAPDAESDGLVERLRKAMAEEAAKAALANTVIITDESSMVSSRDMLRLTTLAEQLDLATVIRVSQAVSGEMVLDSLAQALAGQRPTAEPRYSASCW